MKKTDNEEYEAVQVLQNLVEANLMEQLLNEEDIPFFIREWHDVNTEGSWIEKEGWGWILGRKIDEERIRTLYSERIVSE